MALTFKPPATQRVYDVCVIGSQLGGVLAGALLARRGYRVVLVDHEGLGATYEDRGYLLPYAPAVLPSPRGFPAAEAALVELALSTDLMRSLEPATPDLQLLLPDHRLDLPRDLAVRAAELRREWPADAARLDESLCRLGRLFESATPFMKAVPPLPPSGFGDRRAVGKAIRFAASAPGASESLEEARAFEGLEDHPFVRAITVAQRFLAYLDGDPAPLSMTRLLGAALRGTYRLPGGYESIREMFRRKIAESRGEILGGSDAPAVAEALEISGGKVLAVRLAGSHDAYVARAFVFASDAPAMARLAAASGESKFGALVGRLRPRRLLFTVNLVVKASALPPALGETVLALRDPADGDGFENAVLLQVLSARREVKRGTTEIVADERVVCAAGFVPADAIDGGDRLAEIAGRIREAIADAIPFFDRHLVRESVPSLAASGEARAARLLTHPLYDTDGLSSTLGVTALPARSHYKNLVFAGREVIPGLGMEGDFHAGVQAAGLVAEMLGAKNVLK